MHKIIVFVLFLFLFLGLKTENKKLRIYTKYADFKPLLEMNNDTTYIINFWATWCKPCVAELPIFDSLATDFKNQKIKVILVSIDFDNMVETRVKPFLEGKEIQSKVVVFDDPAQSSWIPKINKDWSGAIPATYIYQGKKNFFHEGDLTFAELVNAVKPFIR